MAPARPAATTSRAEGGALDVAQATAMWPAVLEALKSSSRVAHTLAEGAVPVSRSETTLVLAHPDKSRMDYLRGNKGHQEFLRLAILDVLGLDVAVDLVLDPNAVAPTPAPTPAPPVEPKPDPEPAGPSPRERAAAVVAEEDATSVPAADDIASEDDPDADGDLSGLALVQRELGGTVMTEYDNG